jgi:hypothetical protein
LKVNILNGVNLKKLERGILNYSYEHSEKTHLIMSTKTANAIESISNPFVDVFHQDKTNFSDYWGFKILINDDLEFGEVNIDR